MFQFAQSKGVQVRIRLIEKIFEDASFINADDLLRMPMTYAEVGNLFNDQEMEIMICCVQLKQLLSDILVAAGVPNLTPVASLAFGEIEWANNPEVAKLLRGSANNNGGGTPPQGGAQNNAQSNGRGGGSGRTRRGGGRGTGGNGGGFGGNQPQITREDRVGRFPGDFACLRTADGRPICSHFQKGKCMRPAAEGGCTGNSGTNLHVCGVITSLSPFTLCEAQNHGPSTCETRQNAMQ